MTQPSPGWYPSPADAAELRWWDGNAWTSHTAPRTYDPWAPTPSRRRRIWPWIVFPLVGVVLLMGVGAAIVVPKVIDFVDEFKQPVDAANVYLRDVRDGRVPAAYQQVCVLRYGGMTLDQFVAIRHSQEAEDGRLLGFNAHRVHRIAGHSNEVLVDIDLTTTQGHSSIQALMVRENGHWRWCTHRRVSG